MHRETMSRSVLLALLLGTVPVAPPGAQANLAYVRASDCKPAEKAPWKVELGCLSSGKRSRFFRSFTIALSEVDQQDNILVLLDDESGIDPEGTFRNPDDRLYKAEITFKPERWFKTTAELGEIYSTARVLKKAKLLAATSDPLAGEPEKLHYFARVRREDRWKRFLSAISFSFSASERAQVSGSTVIDPTILSKDRIEGGGSFTFDPDRLIVFPSRVAGAYAALESWATLFDEKSGLKPGLLKSECNQENRKLEPIACLQKLSGIEIKGRWAAALIPTLSWERKDQFDFLQAGGNFISSPLLEDSIDTFNITWDLGATLDTASHRRKALKAIATHEALLARDRTLDKGLQLKPPKIGPVSVGDILVHQLAVEHPAESMAWALRPVPGFALSPSGLLTGVARKGSQRLEFEIEVCHLLSGDRLEGCQSSSFRLDVRDRRNGSAAMHAR